MSKTLSSGKAGASRAAAHQHAATPVQMIRAGVIPQTPGNYRSTTNLTINASHDALDADKAFNNTQRGVITTNNETQSGDPSIGNENHPLQDDHSDHGLLTPTRASNIAPEVDHIVPRTENGANDVRNARVMSKANNHPSSGVPRPNGGARTVAVYQAVTVNGTPYAAGGALSNVDKQAAYTALGVNSNTGLTDAFHARSSLQIATDTAPDSSSDSSSDSDTSMTSV